MIVMWEKMLDNLRKAAAQPNEDQLVHHAARKDVRELASLLDADPSLRDRQGRCGRFPLHVAAEAGRIDCLDLLLKRGASPNARDGLHKWSPMHDAVSADSDECVKRLLEAGANVNAADDRRETPLFYAKSLQVLKRLEAARADLSILSGRGQYPFQYCAAYIRSVEVMRFWVERGVPINHVPDFGWPALIAVCAGPYGPQESPDYERDIEIIELLLAHGADINLQDKNGDTSLYCCCMNQHVLPAEFLLESGTDPNRANRSGDTGLHAAVFRENEPLVRLLLDHGADVNTPNLHHKTPFDVCPEGSEIRNLLAPHHQETSLPVPTAEEVVRRLKAIPKFRRTPLKRCSKTELARLEQHWRVRLPTAYLAFLERMGKGAGEFMVSDHWRFQYDDLFEIARSEEYSEYCELPNDYFVFAERAGYSWVFFIADGNTDDPPVYLFDDSADRTYQRFARSIWEFVESLVIDYEIWSGSDSPGL
jgi:ankyrin repeat protein